ncbi:hypothetical protein FACS1894159_08650 [Bacteroidia bacterium]|nr:hypothetical protein FACS1894159_08650 [Bacteroidia bacterium]
MKRLLVFAAMAAFSALSMVACNDDRGYSTGNYTIAWGTVDTGNGDASVVIRRDNGALLHVVNSRVPADAYHAGQRVIVNYTILGSVGGAPAHYNVSINDLYQVLTKEPLLRSFIDQDQTVREDSIGNDPIGVTRAWFGDRFLNLRFDAKFGYRSQPHLLTLVQDDVLVPDDTIRLYLHHNACDDQGNTLRSGYVSFEVASLLPAGQTSAPVKLFWDGLDGTTHSDRGVFTYPAVESSSSPVYNPGVRASEIR